MGQDQHASAQAAAAAPEPPRNDRGEDRRGEGVKLQIGERFDDDGKPLFEIDGAFEAPLDYIEWFIGEYRRTHPVIERCNACGLDRHRRGCNRQARAPQPVRAPCFRGCPCDLTLLS